MHSLGEIIAKYRKKNKLSQKELSNMLGNIGYHTSNTSVSNWEKNFSEPTSSMLMAVCRVLGITDLYGEYYGVNPDNPLSELNEEGKEKVLEYISLLVDSGKYTPEKVTVIPFTRMIKLFDIPASAGTGSILDGENFTELEVGEEVPADADFGIRISGDSMEPRFINGQIVWIKQQDALLNGEIGIFYLDGNAYCKKLKDDEDGLYLISLNSKYNPIPVTDNNSFKVFGKVVG
jgi:phage repressor protein C with HTH and peptisase S24 domain